LTGAPGRHIIGFGMALKILLVEDDLNIQGFATTVLESAGFEVEACDTLKRARELLKEGPKSLLIVDIGLPDGSGLELCRELKGSGMPFLFLTGRGELKTRLEAFEAGAQDYIQKPFAVEELLARVKVHLRLKKSHDDLAKRNYDLELIERARRDVADMIVHDLKAPLTSIKGTLDIIESRGLITTQAHRQLLDTAGSAAEFMLLMLNDLLDVGHAEQAGLKVEPSDVDLRILSVKLKVLFSSRCERLGVPFVSRIPDDKRLVKTDRNLVFRILANLISNALPQSPRGSEIELSAEHAAGKVVLTVADRGRGVPDEQKQQIFEKYTTGHARGEVSGAGSGIGLTFCRLAVYALRGRIWVEDRPGGGSLFRVELPA
jgi:two-component system sensor histidine kinase/response regulator